MNESFIQETLMALLGSVDAKGKDKVKIIRRLIKTEITLNDHVEIIKRRKKAGQVLSPTEMQNMVAANSQALIEVIRALLETMGDLDGPN